MSLENPQKSPEAIVEPDLISVAFPFFKKKQLEGKIEKSFTVYKTYSSALIASVVVSIVVGFANIFSIVEPAINGRILDSIFMLAGPIIFSLVAIILYSLYQRKMKKR